MAKFTNIKNETLLEIKEIILTGSTGSGSSIKTELSSDDVIILSCKCDDYIAIPYIINKKYFVLISKYMNIGNNLYALGGVNQTLTVSIKYMVVK